MRHYLFASYSVIFLLGFFVLGATDILAQSPLFYNTNPGSIISDEEAGSGEIIARKETILVGGDYSKMSSAAAYAPSLVRQNFNYFFSSPMAVTHSAVAMTGGIIHQGLVKAQEASQREVQGAFQQEQAYLMSLAASPDGERLIAAYRNCKKRMLAGNPTPGTPGIPVTNFHAIKHCVGGYDEIPFVPTGFSRGGLGQASHETQVQLEDQNNRPEPIYVEREVRESEGNVTDLTEARLHCASATYDEGLPPSEKEPECFERSLWDYVYHFVPKRPLDGLIERNPLKWMWSDEKAFYFGNVKYTEYKRFDFSNNSDERTDEQMNEIITRREALAPAKRWVNFWGPNGDSLGLPAFVPPDYEIGTWSPLSGRELIRAAKFQDIYGGLYALSIKMCEHANAEIKLLKHNQYNGLNPKCELWDAPLNAEWSIGNVTVPGLNVDALGCSVDSNTNGRIFPETNDTNDVDYEFLWPSRNVDLPELVNWQPSRYYEKSLVVLYPTIKNLLQNLKLTEPEALMLRDILLYEIPMDKASGEYQCNEILNGVSYGEIMEFSEERTATSPNDDDWMLPIFPLTDQPYRSPKSSAWPIRSKVETPHFYTIGTSNAPDKEKEISKRIALFYNYANFIGEWLADVEVEKHLTSLNNQVNSIKEFPEQMNDAERLITSQLPGESKRGKDLKEALAPLKEHIKDLHLELKSAARFTDKAGKRRNVGAGAGS
jgi:hypothetical protein